MNEVKAVDSTHAAPWTRKPEALAMAEPFYLLLRAFGLSKTNKHSRIVCQKLEAFLC